MRKPVLLLFGTAALFAADYMAEGDLWWAHIQFLADDNLQGRDVGSDGYREAVKYVAGKMETYGLKPAGNDGYLQNVKFETRQLVDDQTSLAIVRGGEAIALERADATFNSRADLAPALEAPMVFVGYGLRIPEAKYDELAGIDLRGKIAVYVNAAGPIGSATIMNPRTPVGANPPGTDGVDPAAGAEGGRGNGGGGRGGAGGGRGSQRGFLLADPNLHESTGQKLAIAITRRGGPKFFEGSSYTYEDILKLARENQPLPKFPLAGTLRSKATVRRESVEA